MKCSFTTVTIVMAAIVSALSSVATAAVPTLQPAVIAIVNMDQVINGSAAGKQAQVDLKAKVDAFQANVTKLKAQFGAEEEALVKARPQASDTAATTAWEAKAQDYQTRRQTAEAGLAQQEKEIQTLRQSVLNQITDAANPLITAIMRESGATIVLPEGATLQHIASIEITAEVIARLDKSLPSVSLSTPAAKP
jgi:outer membrane protein